MKYNTNKNVAQRLMEWYENRTFLRCDEELSEIIKLAYKVNRRKKPQDVKFY